MTRELLYNVALAFVAAFLSSLATAVGALNGPVDKAVLWSFVIAAAYAGLRAVVGALAIATKRPLKVDK